MLKRNIVCNKCNNAISAKPKPKSIIVHGAQEHNLKNICFEIPKDKLVALTGPSGSGKSSIATDILQKECVRQFLESLGMVTDHIAKAKVDTIMGLSPSIGVSQRVTDFNPRSTVGTKTGILTLLRNMFTAMGSQRCQHCKEIVKQRLQDKHTLTIVEIEETSDSSKKKKKSYFKCPHCNHQLEKLEMAHFSSNTTSGACSRCKGVGEIIQVDVAHLLNETKTLKNGGVTLWNEKLAEYYEGIIIAASKYYNFPFDPLLTLEEYTTEQKNFLLYGIAFPSFAKTYKHIKPPKKASEGNFEGLIPSLINQYTKNPLKVSQEIKKYIMHIDCSECNNSGLASLAREVTIKGKTISQVSALTLQDLLKWLEALPTSLSSEEKEVFEAFAAALHKRITNLLEVGLEYLTLDRPLPSLSTGESQRLKLANLLGSELTGMLYVVDEPTTGLHPHDTAKLVKTLRKIQEAGNTVLIIEHDPEVIKQADYIIDIGPGGGSKGGEIVAYGSADHIKSCISSLTGKYLDKKSVITHTTLPISKVLTVYGAQEHNLKNIDVAIPLQQLVVLTGVSGSGKSTFLFDIVDKALRKYLNNAREISGKHASIKGLEHINRIVTVNQASIGNTHSTRSNIATYTKLFHMIRDLFASLPQAKSHGFGSDTFSFNTSNERCQNCNGAGTVEVDMTFMPNIETECPVCNGMRFNKAVLSVHFKGYTIASILDMTINDALKLFKEEKKIVALLHTMKQVGLEHLKLGQSSSTLSGGEAQRIKLATELSKTDTGNTLYLLDEPTTGLHPHEVEKLIVILKKLVNKGNTVVIIEHNLEVMCHANTIIDFGPRGGNLGGKIVAVGTPQEIMAHKDSITGQCLKEYMT